MDRESIISKVKIKLDEVTPPGVDLPFDDFIGPILDECAKDVAMIAPLHLLSPVSMVLNSINRKIDTNVATLGLSSVHPYLVGDVVTISGITTHLEYNGDFPITVITPTSISYALTHANETLTADTGGVVTYKTIFTANKAYIPKPADFLKLYEIKFPLWVKPVREITKLDSEAGKIQDNIYLASGIGRPTVLIQNTMPAGGSLREYLVCGKVISSAVPTALYVKILKPESIPDQLLDSLTWLASSKVSQIGGRGDLAQGLFSQYQNSLTAVAKA